ncbi:MAG TPA: DUF6655 family protein [Tepidisphaeraceae bacterium]|jgi:hypothetical protein
MNFYRGMSAIGLLAAALFFSNGCATVRVTDPAETATQQFLMSQATRLAIQNVVADQLRDRKVFVDPTYLTIVKENSDSLSFKQTPQPYLFLLAELRAKLLLSGARLMEKREDAEIVVEPRTGGISVDHLEYLLGLPTLLIPTEGVASVPVQTPELAIVKSTKQYGFASVAFVAYWRDTGELVASSGPFIGRTSRLDYWILGLGPKTIGDIAPAQAPPRSATTQESQ